MKRILIIVIFLFGPGISAFSQSPVIKTSVDKNNILIGEYLKYNIEANFPANTCKITWPDLPDSFNHFDVVDRSKIDSSEENGMLTCRQVITLTSFDSGRNTIPSFPISFDPVKDDTTIRLFTDSIPIDISYSPLDSTKTFHDIKSIIEVKDEIPWWIWVAGGVLILLLIGIAFYLIKYFKNRKKEQPLFQSKLSPFDEAMQALTDLEKENLLSKGEVRQFHVRLSDILKRYISRKTGTNMLNKTSSEILVSVNDTLLSRHDTALVAGTLRMADAVKFAKYIPPAFESEGAFNDTRKVIEQFDQLIFNDNK